MQKYFYVSWYIEIYYHILAHMDDKIMFFLNLFQISTPPTGMQ